MRTKTLKQRIKTQRNIVIQTRQEQCKPYLSIWPVSLVWFTRYCGKLYCRRLFPYGGLSRLNRVRFGYQISNQVNLESQLMYCSSERAWKVREALRSRLSRSSYLQTCYQVLLCVMLLELSLSVCDAWVLDNPLQSPPQRFETLVISQSLCARHVRAQSRINAALILFIGFSPPEKKIFRASAEERGINMPTCIGMHNKHRQGLILISKCE